MNVPVVAFGSDASDELRGRGGADRLYGGLGSDIVTGGRGNDYLEGGAGMDVYAYSGETSVLPIPSSTNDGDDELRDTDGRGLIRYTFTGSGTTGTTSPRGVLTAMPRCTRRW